MGRNAPSAAARSMLASVALLLVAARFQGNVHARSTLSSTSITQASSPVANNSSVTNSIMNGSSDNPSFYVLAILGDSLSDTGNTFRASGVPDVTVYTTPGRFSNGLMWPDYLLSALASSVKNASTTYVVRNYAYAAATACPPNKYSYIKHLGEQTEQLLADFPTSYRPPGTKLLPVQFISGNDLTNPLFDALETGATLTEEQLADQVADVIQNVISCRLSSATAIAASGAAPDIVLLPTGPLWIVPAVPEPYKPVLQQLAATVDAALAGAVAAVQNQWQAAPAGSPLRNARLHLLGDSSWMGMEGVAGMVKPPFGNTTAACLPVFLGTAHVAPEVKAQRCKRPSSHLFWDQLHPSTRYHRAFAVNGVLPRLQALGLLPKRR